MDHNSVVISIKVTVYDSRHIETGTEDILIKVPEYMVSDLDFERIGNRAVDRALENGQEKKGNE